MIGLFFGDADGLKANLRICADIYTMRGVG